MKPLARTKPQLRKLALLAGLALLLTAGLWYGLAAQKTIALANGRAVLDAQGDLRVFATIINDGPPDRLLSVTSPIARETIFSGREDPAGLPIPAMMSPSLAPDGAHIRMSGFAVTPAPGQLIPFELEFEQAGRITGKARIASEVMQGSTAHGIELSQTIAPTVSLSATRENEGWLVNARLEHFRFAPELLGLPHMPGEGHGHLYLGGVKITRMLFETIEIGALPPGEHRLRLTLSTNDHQTCLSGGAPVSDEITIVSGQ